MNDSNTEPSGVDEKKEGAFGSDAETAGEAPPFDGVPPAPRPLDSGPPDDERYADLQAAIARGDNPFLAVAAMLLRALADIGCRLPAALPQEGVDALHELLRRELHIYTRLCERANLRRDHVLAVRFALCTALDEAANLHAWGGGRGAVLGPWAGQSLLHSFHQEGNGGEKVFLLIGRLAAQADEHMDVLEVMHHILSLGFEGPYRLDVDGRRKHEAIRHRLYTLVAASREPVSRELSPQWRGVRPARFRLPRRVPVWVSAFVAVVMLLSLHAYLRWGLEQQQARLHATLDEIAAMRPPERRAVRLAELLKAEIALGQLAVADAPDGSSTVTFAGDDMFAAGQSAMAVRAQPLLRRLGEELARLAAQQPVTVVVTGHSDPLPIATQEFPDNTALSLARARAVSQVVEQAMGATAAVAVTSTGAGATLPVADNATREGRARNRRVEVRVRPAADVPASALAAR